MSKKVELVKSPTGFRLGISKVAKDLGVSRVQLYLVLTGKHQSIRLMQRIKDKYPELLTEFAYTTK